MGSILSYVVWRDYITLCYHTSMTIFEAIVLGVVQGVTEFLPISSTGHLVLVRSLLEVSDSYALAFDAILHLATAAAVVVYFFTDIRMLARTVVRKLARLPVNPRDMALVYALIAGTIPAVVLGLLLESMMETMLRDPLIIAGVLVVGSVLFMYAEWRVLNIPRANEVTVRKGLLVGLFQSLALIPGMSRSGASIAGGMILGLSRHEAARFAFLLAIPIILGAGSKKLIELAASNEPVAWGAVGLGAVVAFATGLAAIHFMLSFVRRHTLWPFIWYRIILAGVVVLFYWGT